MIRIGWEIQCLPYAGFLHKGKISLEYLYQRYKIFFFKYYKRAKFKGGFRQVKQVNWGLEDFHTTNIDTLKKLAAFVEGISWRYGLYHEIKKAPFVGR